MHENASPTPDSPEQTFALLSAYVDGELSSAEQAVVEQRLSADAEARQTVEELRALRNVFQTLPRQALPANFSGRVLAEAERQMLRRSAEKARPASEFGPQLAQPPLIVPDTLRRRRTLRSLAWFAVACSAAVLLLIFDPGQFGGDRFAQSPDVRRETPNASVSTLPAPAKTDTAKAIEQEALENAKAQALENRTRVAAGNRPGEDANGATAAPGAGQATASAPPIGTITPIPAPASNKSQPENGPGKGTIAAQAKPTANAADQVKPSPAEAKLAGGAASAAPGRPMESPVRRQTAAAGALAAEGFGATAPTAGDLLNRVMREALDKDSDLLVARLEMDEAAARSRRVEHILDKHHIALETLGDDRAMVAETTGGAAEKQAGAAEQPQLKLTPAGTDSVAVVLVEAPRQDVQLALAELQSTFGMTLWEKPSADDALAERRAAALPAAPTADHPSPAREKSEATPRRLNAARGGVAEAAAAKGNLTRSDKNRNTFGRALQLAPPMVLAGGSGGAAEGTPLTASALAVDGALPSNEELRKTLQTGTNSQSANLVQDAVDPQSADAKVASDKVPPLGEGKAFESEKDAARKRELAKLKEEVDRKSDEKVRDVNARDQAPQGQQEDASRDLVRVLVLVHVRPVPAGPNVEPTAIAPSETQPAGAAGSVPESPAPAPPSSVPAADPAVKRPSPQPPPAAAKPALPEPSPPKPAGSADTEPSPVAPAPK